MIIIDTLFEHYEVDENTLMTDTPHDFTRKHAIAEMHSTENTLERVMARALELCPLAEDHTFGEWEDACIRVLLDLHDQPKPPATAVRVIDGERSVAQDTDKIDGRQQAALARSKDAGQAPDRPSSGTYTAISRPSLVRHG